MQHRSLLLAATSLSVVAAPALAAAPPQQAPATRVQEVVITGDPLGRGADEVVSNVAVLTGDAYVQRRQSTLGDTLNGIPGVSSDTFGGGSSRPVIRGQTAPRVKVLSDGAALIDASEVSPDHAVTTEPLLLEGIEILRGPSALLYGGGAIGGAVNLIDRRIPTAVPANGGEGVAEFRLGTADDEEAGVVGLTAGAGNFAVRLEWAGRDTADYEIPGFAAPGHEDEDHDHEHDHEEEHEDHEEDHEDHEDEVLNRLPGSYNTTSTVALGASWIGSRGYLGAAYSEQNSRYGLPGHNHEYEDCHPHGSGLHCGGHDDGEEDHDHDHEHEHGDEVPYVDLKSRRVDVRGELNDPFAGVERVRFRGGWSDYVHQEIEGGEVGTTFANEGYDARVEVQHAPIGGFHGVIGAQVSESDFSALGTEAFLPESLTEQRALFVLEEYVAGDWRFEGALRQEWQDIEAVGLESTSHEPFSASVGANWSFMPGYVASASVARSQRAPSAQELYARGVHLATNTFEIGDADLDEETVVSLDASIRKTAGDTRFSLGAYRYAYDGYIFANTLDRFEDFRLIQYTQADATFSGVEGEVSHDLTPNLTIGAFGDYVRADLDEGGDLPRIPAGRLGASVDWFSGPFSADAEYIRVFEQDRIADFETETPGYDMVNATVAYDVAIGGAQAQVFVRGTNLLDELALNHASFLSRSAPLRGRNFVLGVRAVF